MKPNPTLNKRRTCAQRFTLQYRYLGAQEQSSVPLQGRIRGGCNLRRTVKEFEGKAKCGICRDKGKG